MYIRNSLASLCFKLQRLMLLCPGNTTPSDLLPQPLSPSPIQSFASCLSSGLSAIGGDILNLWLAKCHETNYRLPAH